MKFDTIIKSILKENEYTETSVGTSLHHVGTLLYRLLSDLPPEAKTKTSDLISNRLQTIIDELNEVTKSTNSLD